MPVCLGTYSLRAPNHLARHQIILQIDRSADEIIFADVIDFSHRYLEFLVFTLLPFYLHFCVLVPSEGMSDFRACQRKDVLGSGIIFQQLRC